MLVPKVRPHPIPMPSDTVAGNTRSMQGNPHNFSRSSFQRTGKMGLNSYILAEGQFFYLFLLKDTLLSHSYTVTIKATIIETKPASLTDQNAQCDSH